MIYSSAKVSLVFLYSNDKNNQRKIWKLKNRHKLHTITMYNRINFSALCKSKEDMVLIEVRNLVKKYGNHVAVNDLSFTVEKGQVYGFLGPNGAGKSTTMNILIGYISATEGEVLINGHSIFDEPLEAKKCIGYLPEIPPLYLDMTVKEYLNFAAELKKIKKSERTQMVQEVMEKTKIVDVSKRLIKQLSKGYKQRVGLAQAILGYPEIIILDEPTVGLDPKQIIEIRELIKELSKEHTIILSSHIMQEISAVCDHILIINKGKLVACDTPENLVGLNKAQSEIQLVVKAGKEDVKNLLESHPKIKKFKVEPAEEKGCVTVVITTDSDAETDLKEQLFRIFAKADYPVFSMSSKEKSLEEIFLQLTGDTAISAGETKKEKKGLFKGKNKEEEEEK